MTKSGTKKQSDIRMSLFKSLDELKSFIIWSKAIGLQHFKAGEVEFHISDTARALESAAGLDVPKVSSEERDTKASLLDSEPEDADNDDELLYHSTI